MEHIKNKIQGVIDEGIDQLKTYLSYPTIAAQGKAIPETVQFVTTLINELGGEVKILNDLGGNPVIYAYFAAGQKGNPNRTLLFYNHYDVQPADPLEEWESDPFHATIKDGLLFARGVADNKGDLVARLTAIKALQKSGGLPCNIKFLIEGEEEIGSPNLEPYVETYKDLFAADACIWEFGSKDEKDRIQLVAGLKGMAYMELTCESADIDLHSSYGAIVDNAAWRLTHALASMKDSNNNILVEGFYDGIIVPSIEEVESLKAQHINLEGLKSLLGLRHPFISEAKGYDSLESLVYEPTMTISGLKSGYIEEGTKTVLPKAAMAKLDCRLVPGQDPAQIVKLIKSHLDEHGFSDVKVRQLNGLHAYRSDSSHPFVELVKQTAQEVYPNGASFLPNSPGSGPMDIFGRHLHLPIVSTGVGWFNSKAHAPNESIRLKDFEEGITHLVHLLSEFGKQEE